MGFYYSQQYSHYPALRDEKLSNLPKAIQGNYSPSSDSSILCKVYRELIENVYFPQTSCRTGDAWATYLSFPFFSCISSLFSLWLLCPQSILYPSRYLLSPTKGPHVVAVTSLRSSCSKKSSDPKLTVRLATWSRLGENRLQEEQKGKSACAGSPVILRQEVNPCPIKRLSIIKQFLFVRHFIVIFIGSFY